MCSSLRQVRTANSAQQLAGLLYTCNASILLRPDWLSLSCMQSAAAVATAHRQPPPHAHLAPAGVQQHRGMVDGKIRCGGCHCQHFAEGIALLELGAGDAEGLEAPLRAAHGDGRRRGNGRRSAVAGAGAWLLDAIAAWRCCWEAVQSQAAGRRCVAPAALRCWTGPESVRGASHARKVTAEHDASI